MLSNLRITTYLCFIPGRAIVEILRAQKERERLKYNLEEEKYFALPMAKTESLDKI